MAKDLEKYNKAKDSASSKLQTIMDNPKQRIRNGIRADSVLQDAAKMKQFKEKMEKKYNNKTLKELHEMANPKALVVLLNAFNFRKPDYGMDKYPKIQSIKTGKAILSEAERHKAIRDAILRGNTSQLIFQQQMHQQNLNYQQHVDSVNQLNFQNQMNIDMQNTQMISQMTMNQIHTMQMHNMF